VIWRHQAHPFAPAGAAIEATWRIQGRNPGGDRRSEKARADQGDNVTLKERGNSRAYILARLDRDGLTELAASVRTHKTSAVSAARKAGFEGYDPPPPLTKLRRAWKHASPEERAIFRTEIAS
jgi:hypothetical protein